MFFQKNYGVFKKTTVSFQKNYGVFSKKTTVSFQKNYFSKRLRCFFKKNYGVFPKKIWCFSKPGFRQKIWRVRGGPGSSSLSFPVVCQIPVPGARSAPGILTGFCKKTLWKQYISALSSFMSVGILALSTRNAEIAKCWEPAPRSFWESCQFYKNKVLAYRVSYVFKLSYRCSKFLLIISISYNTCNYWITEGYQR